MRPSQPRFRRAAAISIAAAVLGGALLPISPPAVAQPMVKGQVAEVGVRWSELNAEHRNALKPLEQDWPGIDADQKQKWVEVAGRFPSLSSEERSRVQGRMAQWAKMTPHERGRARLNFEEAKQVSPQDRQAQWEAYQALSPEQKRELAARATPAPQKKEPRLAGAATAQSTSADGSSGGGPSAKSNIVPNPAHAQPLVQVAPTVVQAQPGATTTLITKRPTPPAHQQTGLPKIAATPNFVDETTLLPKRGPQGAATQSASASDARATVRR